MHTFIVDIFSLCCIFSIGLSLCFDHRFAGVCRLLFSVIFASVLFLSIAKVIGTGEGITLPTPEMDAEVRQTFDEVMCEATREGVLLSLCQEFSLSEEDVALTLSDIDPKTHLPKRVVVILKGRGLLTDPRAMEEYLMEGGFSDVRVTLSFDA